MKKINYYVIGGQYASFCYGGTPTLTGANVWLANPRNTGITGRAGMYPAFTRQRTHASVLTFTALAGAQ